MTAENTIPEVTLSEAKRIISALAPSQSVLLLSAPGVGKSAAVEQAAAAAGLECKSLLGTQIAPEDVSGIPRIIGERSVFCPPRVLLPEDKDAKPFCLFLDELPACSPDIQKAFYSLLLERRVGEYPLPKGTWVVAAGNRAEDRSLVRSLSAALVNRVTILNVKVSVQEWLAWAHDNGIRHEILSYILFSPDSLQRPVPDTPRPFSTPRAWAQLSKSLTELEKAGALTDASRKAVSFGMLSPEDAAGFDIFCTFHLEGIREWTHYIRHPEDLPVVGSPEDSAARYFIFGIIRGKIAAEGGRKMAQLGISSPLNPDDLNAFLRFLSQEDRVILLLDLVDYWGVLGAEESLVETFRDLTQALA